MLPMLKKIASLAIVLAMLVCACAVAEEAAEEATQVIELGTSGITMTIDASYVKGDISAEDTDESQVAYYQSDVCTVDFDIYQWVAAEGETLADVAAAEAAEYESEAVETEFNGVAAFYYEAVEEYEGTEYNTTTFLMQNGDVFAEIVFWMDGEGAGDIVEGIVNTISIAEEAEIADEGTEIVLGTSTLKITTPYTYVKGDISAEDTDENQVAYYSSEETAVDFDVYQWAKAEGEVLADIAAAEAAEFGAEIAEITVGDIVLEYYNAVEEFEGTEYDTVTYITEDGDDFVELVFWLDGDDAAEIVDAIINSIAR